MRPRAWIVIASAGLVLADASIVTLALPQLLKALDTSVEGVAAVIAVYTGVLALSLLPAEGLRRRWGSPRAAALGFALFALASVVCAGAESLTTLLLGRGIQACGGALGLVATFELIAGGTVLGRRHWLGAAVFASAVGPALGGALTQAFDWRAIFIVQVPVALVGAVVAWSARSAEGRAWLRAGPVAGIVSPAASALGQRSPRHPPDQRLPSRPPDQHSTAGQSAGPSVAEEATWAHPVLAEDAGAGWRGWGRPADAVALALVSAALTAVLFGLVLLLIAGWAVEPLAAAATVTVLPIAAIAGSRLPGSPRGIAAVGSLLVAGGVLALAWLPSPSVAWTFAPQALAGIGMGMALPAFAGELLPERTTLDAARLLTVRHVGIALVLIALAPLIANRLDTVTEHAQQQGIALVLDASLPPQDKLTLAPELLAGIEAERPRAGLETALAKHRSDYSGDARTTFDTLATRADDTLVSAVSDAFRTTFVIAAALALLAAALVALSGGRLAALGAGAAIAAILAIATPVAYAALHASNEPAPVVIQDPCDDRALPNSGGISGFLQDRALQALDAGACRLGSSREELVLALANDEAAQRFEERYGVDPSSVGGLLNGLISP